MRRTAFGFVLLAFGLSAVGCTPSVEETCKRIEELGKDDKKFNFSMEKCLKNMNEMKDRDPDAYKCSAKLTKKLSNLDTVFMAISVCDKNRPKKGKGGDDDGDKDKKKKKGDDD